MIRRILCFIGIHKYNIFCVSYPLTLNTDYKKVSYCCEYCHKEKQQKERWLK